MALTTPSRHPTIDRPIPGRCASCGLGFTAVNPTHTLCRPCWFASRSVSGVVDPRAGKAAAGRELPNGAWRAAAPADTRAFKAPSEAKGRAATLRLQALAAERQARELRAEAFDVERGRVPAAPGGAAWLDAINAFLGTQRGEVA